MIANGKIEFSFSGTARLLVREVWPDGDAPEDITAAAVVKQVMKKGVPTVSDWLNDWGIEDALEVTVGVPIERDEKRHATLYDTADVRFR